MSLLYQEIHKIDIRFDWWAAILPFTILSENKELSGSYFIVEHQLCWHDSSLLWRDSDRYIVLTYVGAIL